MPFPPASPLRHRFARGAPSPSPLSRWPPAKARVIVGMCRIFVARAVPARVAGSKIHRSRHFIDRRSRRKNSHAFALCSGPVRGLNDAIDAPAPITAGEKLLEAQGPHVLDKVGTLANASNELTSKSPGNADCYRRKIAIALVAPKRFNGKLLAIILLIALPSATSAAMLVRAATGGTLVGR